jgi:prepilin-type N-terminal cleavage/methylation domain-containing protein
MKVTRSGFTLIEILAAVAVLFVLVGIVGAIFTESDRAWNLGTGRAMNNNEGRAALNMIAHDLQYAVADDRLTFHMGPDRDLAAAKKPYGYTNLTEICFVSMEHDSSGTDTPRTAREIHYYVREEPNTKSTLGTSYTSYELVRHYWSSEIVNDASNHCYFNANWYKTGGSNPGRPTAGGPIAANVVGFSVFAPGATNKYDSIDYTNQLPQYVDIYLELLNERDAAEAAKASDRNYIERATRRYATRIYFHNAPGYRIREGRKLSN